MNSNHKNKDIILLEEAISQIVKESFVLDKIKHLFANIPERYVKSVSQEIMLIAIRAFSSNSKKIQDYVWKSFEANVLNNHSLIITNLETGRSKPVLHEYFYDQHPDNTLIEFPNIGIYKINDILEIIDGEKNDFFYLFENEKEAITYAKVFYDFYSNSQLSWLSLYGPILFAAQGYAEYLRNLKDPTELGHVIDHYKEEAISIVTQLGILPLNLFNYFVFMIEDIFGTTGELLFYLLITLPIIKPTEFLFNLFKKIFNTDVEDIDKQAVNEVLGLPLCFSDYKKINLIIWVILRSTKMEFNFDKFVNDLDKRQENLLKERQISNQIKEEDERRRLRNEQYNEKWQNRIVWEKSNEPWYFK